MQSVIDGLGDATGQAAHTPHYVFISTDSVFMACDREEIEKARSERGCLREEDAHEPASRDAQKRARRRNSYQVAAFSWFFFVFG